MEKVKANSQTATIPSAIPAPHTQASVKLYEDRVICVPKEGTITDVIHLMKKNHIGDVIVVETKSGKAIPVGIITDRDIALALESTPPKKLVLECMTTPISVGNQDDDLFALVDAMKTSGVGRLPLVDNEGGLVGIVTARKLLQKITLALEDLVSLSERQHEKEARSRH